MQFRIAIERKKKKKELNQYTRCEGEQTAIAREKNRKSHGLQSELCYIDPYSLLYLELIFTVSLP